MRQILDFGDPLPQLILTGGDPLTRPDLYDLIDEARHLGIGKFKAVIFFQGDDQLQGIHRIQSQAARPEQRLVIPDFRRADFEHQVIHQHLFDLPLEFR